jgi:hypothetical protein
MKLSDLKTIASYQENHVSEDGVLFPTLSSLQWFIRCYRNELIESQAIITGRGSRPTLLLPTFESVVLKLLRDHESLNPSLSQKSRNGCKSEFRGA